MCVETLATDDKNNQGCETEILLAAMKISTSKLKRREIDQALVRVELCTKDYGHSFGTILKMVKKLRGAVSSYIDTVLMDKTMITAKEAVGHL